MAIPTNGLQLVRIAGAVFNQQLSATDYSEILTANKTAAELNAWANSAVAAQFKGKTTTDISKAVLANLGLTQPGLEAWLAGQLTAGGGVAKAGETMLGLLNDYSNMTADATFGASATTFNTKAAASQALSLTAGTATGTYAAVSTANAALTLTAATQTSTGTAGDDTFTAAAGTWGVGDKIDGGTGTDTLNATITGTGPTQSATSLVGVEVLNVTASPNPATLDLTGVAGLTEVNNASSANGATLSVTGLGKVVNTTITGGNTSTSIAYATAAVAGTADAATVSLKGAAAGSSFTTSGVETLTINSGTSANTLSSVSATGMTRLVITGDQALTILGTVGNSGTTTPTTAYDASAATGAVTLTQTGSGLGTSGAGVTVTGPTAATAGAFTVTTGGNNDTVTLGANANTVDTGAGNDVITSGGGANTITPGTGNDTINAGAGVDTIRLATAGATDADTINTFGSTDVIAVNIGAAAVTGTSAAAASASTAFGVVPTGATSPVLQNVAGTATANAVTFQAIAPNATATVGTVAGTSNVIALNGAYTDGTAAGVISALGTSATTGIATTATGKFLLVTYSVGNIAQVWSFGGDNVGPTGGNQALDTDITSSELSLVATLNGVALNGLTAANFSTYLTPVAASTTVSNAGQTINLTGTLNTVLSTANTAGQFLTAGADTINVGVGTLPTTTAGTSSGLTIIDPGTGDADVLNATVLGADWHLGSLISGVETVNLNMLVAGSTFSAAARTPGTTTFGLTGTQNFTATALPNAGGVTLGSGYTGTATATLVSDTGSSDSLVVNLAGSTATTAAVGANLVYTQNAVNVANVVETATVNVSAASSIRVTGDDLFATNPAAGAGGTTKVITATNLAGSGSLTIYGTAANLGTMNLNGSGVGYTGALTLRPTTNAAMDFSTNTSGAGLVTGISTINLSDSADAYASAITLAATNTTTTSTPVTISFAPASSTATVLTVGAMTVSKAGSGQSDAVILSLGANATTVTSVTANTIENFTVNSSRAAANSLTLGNITLDNGAGAQTITVTSASTVAANATFTADVVNFSGVTGNVTGPLVLANDAGVSFTGGSGNTAVTGSANPDVINTGIGNDTIIGQAGNDIINAGDGTNSITGGAGADTMTGGAGVDTYIFDATAGNASNGANAAAVAEVITNFTRSTDKLQFTNVTDVVSAQQDAVQTAVTALAAGSTDAQIATAMANASTTNLGVSFAVFNGSTYVYYETTGGTATHVAADNIFIKLVGITTLPTFAADVIA